MYSNVMNNNDVVRPSYIYIDFCNYTYSIVFSLGIWKENKNHLLQHEYRIWMEREGARIVPTRI